MKNIYSMFGNDVRVNGRAQPNSFPMVLPAAFQVDGMGTGVGPRAASPSASYDPLT